MTAPAVARCGSESGERRHRRLGEPVCPECRAARATAQRRRYARAPQVPDLPRLDPEVFEAAPCTRDHGGNPWDAQRDGELLTDARERWQYARRICLTRCPVLAECERLREQMPDPYGVWAGLTYGVPPLPPFDPEETP